MDNGDTEDRSILKCLRVKGGCSGKYKCELNVAPKPFSRSVSADILVTQHIDSSNSLNLIFLYAPRTSTRLAGVYRRSVVHGFLVK